MPYRLSPYFRLVKHTAEEKKGTETQLVVPSGSFLRQALMDCHMALTTSLVDEVVTWKSLTEEHWT